MFSHSLFYFLFRLSYILCVAVFALYAVDQGGTVAGQVCLVVKVYSSSDLTGLAL